MAPLEQRRNRYEWLGLAIRFEDNLIAARFVGVCALHETVGTILPSGPLSTIASFGSSEGHSLNVGPPGCRPSARKKMDALLRGHAKRGMRTLFAAAYSKDCLLADSSDRAFT